MWAHGFECALSSACLVSCWSLVFRSRHSSSLFTLLICSLLNLLVFAVSGVGSSSYVVCCVCLVSCPVLSCPALACPALSSLACLPVCFSAWGCFCLLLLLIIKSAYSSCNFGLALFPLPIPDNHSFSLRAVSISIILAITLDRI